MASLEDALSVYFAAEKIDGVFNAATQQAREFELWGTRIACIAV